MHPINNTNASTLSQLAAAANTLGAFCGKRDIAELTPAALEQKFGIRQVDVAVLFGGSIYSGGDLFAGAIRNRLARKFVIVGGEGHTTATLRRQICAVCPAMTTEGHSEAEIFAGYLQAKYGVPPNALECRSTNCGNNITFLQALLLEQTWPCRSILFLQDATMQHRMEATFRKFFAPETLLINFAAYQAEVVADDGKLCFATTIPGMWEMERYLSLLMGEIPRLADDAGGYGPKGKNYIASVEIPESVLAAWQLLKTQFPDSVRIADAKYA